MWARIFHTLGAVAWSVDGAVLTTSFSLIQAVGHGQRKVKDREHVWLPLQDAISEVSHIETRELLQPVEQRRSRRASASPAYPTSTTST